MNLRSLVGKRVKIASSIGEATFKLEGILRYNNGKYAVVRNKGGVYVTFYEDDVSDIWAKEIPIVFVHDKNESEETTRLPIPPWVQARGVDGKVWAESTEVGLQEALYEIAAFQAQLESFIEIIMSKES